jgi:hypothetical protein
MNPEVLEPQQPVTGDIAAQARLAYAALRGAIVAGAPAALLHIGADQTVVAAGSGGEPALMLLAIGWRKTAREHFRHEPPAPGELENAIQAVEDEVSRARALIAPDARLYTGDAAIREIALLAGAAGGADLLLNIEAAEQMFDRMAAISMGRPAGQDTLPAGAAFRATLLILREFMHHLQFQSITLKA